MKLIILAAVLILLTAAPIHCHRTGIAGSGAGAQHHRHAANAGSGPICYSCCRQPGSDRAYPHQSSAHHCDSASGTREHSRFCSGRLRVLALDRRSQSRFLETHLRGCQYQRRPGLRIRPYLLLPGLRAARPTAFSRADRQRGRERPSDFTNHTSARLCGAGPGCRLSTDGRAGAANRLGRADPGGTAGRRGPAASRGRDQFLPGRLSHAPESSPTG